MIAIVSLLIILSLSLLITRIGTTALTLTGLSHELARLQAVSAFTGVGFTTNESEHIVRHPARRQVLIAMMVLGNAGIVTAVSSLILSFGGVERSEGLERFLWLLAGVGGLWIIAMSSWIEGHLTRGLRWALGRWTELEVRDYANLLQLTGDYTVTELTVEAEDWLAGRKLRELNVDEEGVSVLAIHRSNGDFLGVPRGRTQIEAGDRLVLYGRGKTLEELDWRKTGTAGDLAHEAAVQKQEQVESEQEAQERRREIGDSIGLK